MLKNIVTIILSAVVIIIVGARSIYSNSTGAQLMNSGSPGDNHATCSKPACHNNVVNSGPGSISIDLSSIPAQGYNPGETYTISVNVSENGITNFGFQITAEDASGNKMGTYTAGTTSKVIFDDWVTHKNTISNSWTFGWKAPQSGPQTITFYAAGNAANGNGLATGDHIYTTTSTVQKNLFASVTGISETHFNVLYNDMSQTLIIECEKDFKLAVYDVKGVLKKEADLTAGKNHLSLEGFPRGLFIFCDKRTGQSRKLIL